MFRRRLRTVLHDFLYFFILQQAEICLEISTTSGIKGSLKEKSIG